MLLTISRSDLVLLWNGSSLWQSTERKNETIKAMLHCCLCLRQWTLLCLQTSNLGAQRRLQLVVSEERQGLM